MTERSVDKKTEVRSTEEALKLALEALEVLWDDGYGGCPESKHMGAITAIREALAEQPAQHQCMEHGECFGGECIYPATQPAQQHIEHCLWARNGNQPCPHVQPEQEPVAWAEFDFEAQKFTGRTAAKFSDVESVGHRCEWVPQLHQPTHQPAQQQELASASVEPVAWKDRTYGNLHHQDFGNSIPLYTSPPASKPLTDEQILSLVPGLQDCLCDPWDYNNSGDYYASIPKDMIRLARAIEAAHGIKEKNT